MTTLTAEAASTGKNTRRARGKTNSKMKAVAQNLYKRWGVPPSFESNNLPAARLWLEVGYQLHFCVFEMIIEITITGGQV